jgi:hypothetical protein
MWGVIDAQYNRLVLPGARGWAPRDRAAEPLADQSRRPCTIAHVTSDVPGGSNFVFSRPQVVQPGRDCLANNSRKGPSPPTYRSIR